jgi:hypothetical protein
MDYAIAIGIVSALLVVIITLIVFAALCRKKNKCKTNANSKDDLEYMSSDNKLLFWKRFISKPTIIHVKESNATRNNRLDRRSGPSGATLSFGISGMAEVH